MISSIVHKINEEIAAKIADYPCLLGMQFFGLAEPVVRSSEDEQLFPVIVDFTGEDTAIVVDDDYPAGLYHRLLSKSYSAAPTKQQYGNQNVRIAEADMLLVCWAFRNKIKTTADVLEGLLYSVFDDDIRAVQSSFDRRAVFAGEFSGFPFFLPEDVMLFGMKYRFKYPAKSRECLEIPNFCN